jgi:hypothetical protein
VDTAWTPPSWWNAELKALAAGMVGACWRGRLTFEQRHFAGHGPIIFELERLVNH